MGSDENYVPGTNGNAVVGKNCSKHQYSETILETLGSALKHYRIEIPPVDFQSLNDIQRFGGSYPYSGLQAKIWETTRV